MPRILFVDDEAAARQNYNTILTHYGYQVVLVSDVRQAVEALKNEGEFDLIITDMRMGRESGLDMLREAKKLQPTIEVIVLTGHAELANAIEAMKLGASDYITKDTDYKEILVIVEKALEKRGLKSEINRLREQLRSVRNTTRLVGKSKAISQIIEMLERVAPTDSRVLITGESGTGKELVAETLHANSLRRDGPFIAINCGAIPNELQESELFGHVKGAYTGADTEKKGLLETANNGTVFLDEVGEMTSETQVKLLRFLEKGELFPVGATQPRTVDVRIISATNRDLGEAVRQKQFREDLYYRLKVVSIHLPALRERKEDIPLIAKSLLNDLNTKTHRHIKNLSPETLEVFLDYSWPGNVRELKNVLERSMIFTDTDTIGVENLPEDLFTRQSQQPTNGESKSGAESLEDVERKHILSTLEKTGGNKLLTAKQLNIATTTLYRKLKQYGIE